MTATSVRRARRATAGNDGASRGLGDRRTSARVRVEGFVLVWRASHDAPQPARMRDVSVGGALLETPDPLRLGEEIRVEIDGDYSSFTMDALVMRSGLDDGGRSSFGIRFVPRPG